VDHDLLDDLFDGATVYVCNTAIPNFVKNFLPKLVNKIVLYSGDSDETLDLGYLGVTQILESDMITKWFPQNCVFEHPKVTHLPIGLDYHTLFMNEGHSWGPRMTPVEQEAQILSLKAPEERTIASYSNWHFHLKRGDRQEAYDRLPKDFMFYEPREVPRLETHKRMITYKYVASPYGGGPDCHRTWEALALGCIPIVKRCGLEKGLFDDMPVILVDDWSEVARGVEGTCLDKLYLDHWIGDKKKALQCLGMQAVVVIAHYNEDLSWVSKIKYEHIVYSKTLPDAANVRHQSVNKGNEASAYMQYIVDHFDTLPEYALFVHGHDTSWHHDGSIVDIINGVELSPYKSLNKYPTEKVDPRHPDVKGALRDFPLAFEFPPDVNTLHYDSCAMFCVSRDSIRRRPREFYERYLEYLWTTSTPNFYNGRVGEYTYRWMFKGYDCVGY
jgi:hypothetical protein